MPTDVTNCAQVGALVAHAEKDLGSVGVLVNCAGVMYYTLMENLREDDWSRIAEVNYKGTPNCIGAFLEAMLARGRGHLAIISSDPAGRSSRISGPTLRASYLSRRSRRGCAWRTAGRGLRITTLQPGHVVADLLALSTDVVEALGRYG